MLLTLSVRSVPHMSWDRLRCLAVSCPPQNSEECRNIFFHKLLIHRMVKLGQVEPTKS